MFLLAPLGFFYLFILPTLVANKTMDAGLGGVLFAAFLYGQFWMLTAEYAYSSAAALYGFRRKHLWPFLLRREKRERQSSDQPALADVPGATSPTSGFATAALCFLSYAFTLYGFAVAYVFISNRDLASFKGGPLGIVDSFYFSVITAATIGYGDITPQSTAARLTVLIQVFVNIVYGVFLFSILAGRLQPPTLKTEGRSKE